MQVDLFDDNIKIYNLYQAMDKVRNKFGEDKIKRGSLL